MTDNPMPPEIGCLWCQKATRPGKRFCSPPCFMKWRWSDSNLATRFWPRVKAGGPEECWHWTGKKNQDGYGRVQIHGRKIAAHRVSYELSVGPIGEGLVIDHMCRNTSCVNPAHLRAVTQRENTFAPWSQSPAVAFKAQTHCLRGHEFTPENTYVMKNGGRSCRTCQRDRAYAKHGKGVGRRGPNKANRT